MIPLSAIYLDGKSAKNQSVKIYLENERIVFYSLSQFNQLEKQEWEIGKIDNQHVISADQLLLSYGQFPQQSLQIDGKENIAIIREKFPSIFTENQIYQAILGENKWKIISIGLLFLVAIASFYFLIVVPYASEKIVTLFPIETEIEFGKKISATLIDEFKLVDVSIDKNKSKILERFFTQAGFKSNYPIKIYVVKQEIINAFAIPGGSIFVYEGIINQMKSHDELAGLLAHELAHIEKRHSLKMISKNLANYVVLSVLTSDVSGLIAIITENASLFQQLSNSRAYEKEADLSGVDHLNQLNTNPKGMQRLFSEFEKEEDSLTENQKKYLSFLTTHPFSSERINYLDKKIKKDNISTKIFPKRKDLEALFGELKKK